MSTNEQPNQNIIFLENDDLDNQYEHHEELTNQSPIDLQNQPELPVSLTTYFETYDAFHISEKFVVIRINGTNTLVIVKYPCRSKSLHVHIIEDLHPVYDIDGNNFNEVFGHIIFVIFHDHILRIHLENQTFIHLDNKISCSSFKECKTDFSFRISRNEKSSFRIIEDDKNEHLRACLILDEITWKKVELFEINLFSDDECIFAKYKNIFIRLPPNITGIEINLEDGYVILTITLNSKCNSLEFSIYIDFRENDGTDSIFLLNDCERCILTTSEQLRRFQQIGFESVAMISVCPFEDHDEFPEIKEFIKDLLELNKYHRCRWDSDCGSDSD